MTTQNKTNRSRIITFIILSLLLLAVIWIAFQSGRDNKNSLPTPTHTKVAEPTAVIEETATPLTQPTPTQTVEVPEVDGLDSYPYPGYPLPAVSPLPYPLPTIAPPTPYPE